MRHRSVCAAAFFILNACTLAATALATDLDVAAVDARNQPVAGVQVQLTIGADVLYSAVTGADGHARFLNVKAPHDDLAASREGFEPARKSGIDLTGAELTTVELTLAPALARRDSIEVKDSVADQPASRCLPSR